jgi:CelD/BcsL family acetyltransferase involved in cellulose biosynthesis
MTVTHGGVRTARTLEATGLDERSWNDLASRGTYTVFQTHQWHHSWLSAYGKQYEPRFIVVERAGVVAGVAPLMIEQSSQGRVARFIGDGRSDYCDVLGGSDGDIVSTMLGALNERRDWDVLDLRNIPGDSTTIEYIRASCRISGHHVIVRDQFVCPSLMIRGQERVAHEIANKASLRRRHNRLERMGQLSYRDLTAAADILPLLDQFFEQHEARWQQTDTPSLFREAANRTFYRELTKRLDGTNWLTFSLVELDGSPIAIHYGFDFNDSLIWYKPSFAPALSARSPGLVLVRHLIGRAVALNRREFDFTVGREAFKLRFSNFARKTVQVQVFRDPARYAFERSKLGVLDTYRRVTATFGKGL